MGRERLELKKIEKAAARHVSFSKRRKGLIKKAKELSVLCDAEVGLIVFSAMGRLFEYSNPGMKMILKKYCERFTGILNSEMLIGLDVLMKGKVQMEVHSFLDLYWLLGQLDNQDFGRVNQEMENINHTLRHMDGEDLQELTVKELQTLEQKLEVGLHRIRSTKGKQIEEDNTRLHLKSSNSENNTAVKFLLIEPSETRDHRQSSESIHNSYTPKSRHKTSIIQNNEVSDTSLRLGLSI